MGFISGNFFSLICVFISVTFFSFGQTVDENGVDLQYRIKQAEKKFLRAEYDEASIDYFDLIRYFPNDAFLHFQLAEASFKMRDYVTAQESYRLAFVNDSLNFRYAQFMMARMMKYNSNYEDAAKEFDLFLHNEKNAGHPEWMEQATLEKQGCFLALQEKLPNKNISVIHLDSTINHYFTESSPLQLDSATLIYSTLRMDSMDSEHYFNIVPALSHFYRSVKTKNGWSEGERIFSPINNYDFHSGNGTLTQDGKRFYFTECPFRMTGDLNCYISISNYHNGDWGNPDKLNKEINQKDYVSTQPTVAADKNGNDVLYFVSDREGGMGGMDIWKAVLQNGEMISPPENLGQPINTKGNEITPFFDKKNQRLYFSSDFRIGMGGYDIYYSEEGNNYWSNPVNVGMPVNSSVDDMYYSAGFDTSEAFIISNRTGIIGLQGPTCCDDIFMIKHEQTKTVWLKKIVVLNQQNVSDTLKEVGLIIKAFSKNGTPSSLDTFLSDPATFKMKLEFDNTYEISAVKKNWITPPPSVINPKDLQESKKQYARILMEKIKAEPKILNVYYQYDSDSILPESFSVLDTVNQILNNNPSIKIELASHTDSRGSAEYNLDLSQNRAEACKAYLVKKGIDPLRIIPIGYGETRQLQDCLAEKLEGCSEDPSTDCPCHQKNRRTEFRIIAE